MFRIRCKLGKRKPSVFPVPVLARLKTSCPERMGSQVLICTGVRSTNPSSCKMSFKESSRLSNSEKVDDVYPGIASSVLDSGDDEVHLVSLNDDIDSKIVAFRREARSAISRLVELGLNGGLPWKACIHRV